MIVTKSDLIRFSMYRGCVVHCPDHKVGTKVFAGFVGAGCADGKFKGSLMFNEVRGETKTCSWTELTESPKPVKRYRRERTE